MSSKTMNLVQSINSTLDYMMTRDTSIILLGEDIGVDGGVFRVTEGLQKKYGAEKVINVKSFPSCKSDAFPMGISYSSSGTSCFWLL